ncbi:hypothetical protein HanRHA438_Chr07g0302401 [Helianthus annuus]|uniref:Uncharacterized protein n=1 Tax=Helianthus annuus TaxID=4232 RepID=A0A9K3IKZ8_HELAN|nr:hypothetical protein HanXRQr2_Chr07g0291921 [Helianthus annuus]KAJ0549963.1 hypothetical protein HanHA300_Chr07g0240061 [Helianthus annuus]KAJ0562923.1 hypothetical protein HanHA89_Chr07g0257291 [Helianthus annuus]KAJ0728289.1 hypothetical protein HanLR1_Chr07g0239941 [Helianthus annuus]KAJ0904478.1 hypothetical protein HanPSC8_Chr07g0282691 [Helianthus annuus]
MASSSTTKITIPTSDRIGIWLWGLVVARYSFGRTLQSDGVRDW